jgi:transcriptional regulator with XRE-family HTH domain
MKNIAPNQLRADIGRRLRARIEEKAVTLESIGEQVGLTKSAISQYLSGATAPSIDILPQLASILDMSLDHMILGRVGQPVTRDEIDLIATYKALPDEFQAALLAQARSFLSLANGGKVKPITDRRKAGVQSR